MSRLHDGETELNNKRYRSAVENFTQAIRQEPTNGLAHQGLARSFYHIRDYRRAADECSRALELAPHLAWPNAILGSIYIHERKYKEGEDELKIAIGKQSDLEQAYIWLTQLLIKQGRLIEAQACAQQIVDINPRSNKALNNLTWVLFMQKEYSKGTKVAKQAFALDRTLKGSINLLLATLSGHPRATGIAMLLLMLPPFVVRSYWALIPIAPIIGCSLLGGIILIRNSRSTVGVPLILAAIILAVLALSSVTTGPFLR
jgi:tetratricopeptide (TPR) repeat protein